MGRNRRDGSCSWTRPVTVLRGGRFRPGYAPDTIAFFRQPGQFAENFCGRFLIERDVVVAALG